MCVDKNTNQVDRATAATTILNSAYTAIINARENPSSISQSTSQSAHDGWIIYILQHQYNGDKFLGNEKYHAEWIHISVRGNQMMAFSDLTSHNFYGLGHLVFEFHNRVDLLDTLLQNSNNFVLPEPVAQYSFSFDDARKRYIIVQPIKFVPFAKDKVFEYRYTMVVKAIPHNHLPHLLNPGTKFFEIFFLFLLKFFFYQFHSPYRVISLYSFQMIH